MIGRTNAVSKPGVELSIVVSVTSGAAVTATKGSKTVNGTAAGGSCVLSLPEAGTWSVKATLNGQTSDTKSVSAVDSYAVALTFFSATITVNVDSGASVTLKKGSTTIATKTSNGTAVFTVTETGAYTVTATKNGQTTSGSVNVVSGTTSYALTLSFVSSTLNNNEWSVIKSVSDAGQGANYWSIGDRKAVTLNGTMSKLTLSNFTTYAFISGFRLPHTRNALALVGLGLALCGLASFRLLFLNVLLLIDTMLADVAPGLGIISAALVRVELPPALHASNNMLFHGMSNSLLFFSVC